ncbi:MFS transporter [Dysgonomonas sp. 521]|uniref:MFS transporter n=1 Tax=Dysgonomonas sp. 521 TaxID=2302932 RepID=UPI0013D19802|nr:MFS transporter [Dysgonomonas sp. 521]NDV94611.1 MFS transporter [Dysgonomonas sp. 521]
MTQKQINYVGPFITLVFLFFVVGFLTTANGQFQGPLKAAFLQNAGDLKNTFATLITFSWFLAYPLTGGIGSSWVTKYGYKGTLVRGLFIMIVGLFIFFLSSWFTVKFPDSSVQIASATVPSGFFIFLIGSFVVGASATILQVVINPYLVACTVKGTQPIQRLAIGGSSNSIGTTIAPFFVTGIVFGGLSMEQVQVSQLMTPFIALVVVMFIVALVVMKLSLPDIEGTKAEAGEKLEKSVWSFTHLTLGVIAIFFYVGVEVAIGANINLYAIEQEALNGPFSFFGSSSLTIFGINFAIPALMATLYWGGMLIGRLVGSSLSKVPPRVQLVVTTVSATTLTILAIAMNSPWLLVAVGLFHSIMWGAIFTLSVAKLGKYTSVASGVFMIGVVGGAILPLLQGMLADAMGGWRWTWLIVIFGEVYMLYYALLGSRVRQSAE